MGGTRTGFSIKYSSSYRAMFGALAVGWFVWLLFVGTVEMVQVRKQTSLTVQTRSANLMQGDKVGRPNLLHPKFDLNAMSKRRVPRGPDPIHNRKTRNSVRPPGEAN